MCISKESNLHFRKKVNHTKSIGIVIRKLEKSKVKGQDFILNGLDHDDAGDEWEIVNDEIYFKRHRPLELIEKRSRKREIELLRYNEHLGKLKREAPQLWSRKSR